MRVDSWVAQFLGARIRLSMVLTDPSVRPQSLAV